MPKALKNGAAMPVASAQPADASAKTRKRGATHWRGEQLAHAHALLALEGRLGLPAQHQRADHAEQHRYPEDQRVAHALLAARPVEVGHHTPRERGHHQHRASHRVAEAEVAPALAHRHQVAHPAQPRVGDDAAKRVRGAQQQQEQRQPQRAHRQEQQQQDGQPQAARRQRRHHHQRAARAEPLLQVRPHKLKKLAHERQRPDHAQRKGVRPQQQRQPREKHARNHCHIHRRHRAFGHRKAQAALHHAWRQGARRRRRQLGLRRCCAHRSCSPIPIVPRITRLV